MSSHYGCLQESLSAYKQLDTFAAKQGFGSIKQIFQRIQKVSNQCNQCNSSSSPSSVSSQPSKPTKPTNASSSSSSEQQQQQHQHPQANLSVATATPTLPPPQVASTVQQSQLSVLVTVPEGSAPGQPIHVTAPDGSGRVIMASVPPNSKAGSTFAVEFPPAVPLSVTGSPMPTTMAATSPTLGNPQNPPQQQQLQQQHVVTATMDNPSTNNTSTSPNSPKQSLIQVQVPSGTPPGSTIYVQVPGEPGRMIGATVPDGCVDQFHVTYTPMPPKIEKIAEGQGPIVVSGFDV